MQKDKKRRHRCSRLLYLTAAVATAASLAACGGSSSQYDSNYGPTMDRGGYGGAGAGGEEVVAAGADMAPMAEMDDSDGLFGDMVAENEYGGANDRLQRSHRQEASKAVEKRKKVDTAQAPPDQPADEDDGENQTTEPSTGEPTTPAATETDPDVEPPQKRLIIYTGNLGVYVLDIALGIERTLELAESLGGWMQSSTSTSVTVRVPAEKFHTFVEKIADIGRITERKIVGQDVTQEFYDLRIRLRNAMELRERYSELLAKAETVEDALKIEQELARLTEKIERLKGRIRFLSQHAAHSTVTVRFFQDAQNLPKEQRVRLPFRWLSRYSIEGMYR